MPYIDEKYAAELLRKSGNATDADMALAGEVALRELHVGRDACLAESAPAKGDVHSTEQKRANKARARKRLENAEFTREPLFAECSKEEQAAFEKVKRLACARERGTRELVDRLVRDGFAKEDARHAVERAVECGLVNDIRYGAVLVRTRVSQGRGRHGIEQELERAGITATDIPGWPEEFFYTGDFDPFRADDADFDGIMRAGFGGESSDEAEVERALSLLRRKPPRAKNVQASAYRKLISKGYSSSVASAAVRRFLEEN